MTAHSKADIERWLVHQGTTSSDTSWMRSEEGLGRWEGRGKVTIQGWGVSDMLSSWDGTSMDKTLGALAISAIELALADAGVGLDEVDGLMCCPQGADGSGGPAGRWAPRPYFEPPYDSEDGLSIVTGAWLLENMHLPNVKFAPAEVPSAPGGQMGFAAQAIADGRCETALVVYPMARFEGAYRRGGAAAQDYATGPRQWRDPWGPSVADPIPIQQYCTRYGTTWEDLIGPLVVNQHRNGLLNSWSYYNKFGPSGLDIDMYTASRPIVWPLRVWDCDRPVHVATAYLFTTPERARNMRHRPVYVINHNEGPVPQARSTQISLDEVEAAVDRAARLVWEGTGWKPQDVDIFNPYDGYATFMPHLLEGFQWHGVGKGDATELFRDIRVKGPHPFSSGGGNLGNGRTRSAMFIDCIEQLRGTAGDRQVSGRAETAVCSSSYVTQPNFFCLASSPD